MRKRAFLICLLVTGLIGSGPIQVDAQEVQFQTGVHLDWWKNTDDFVGHQVYLPVMFGLSYKDFSFRILSGQAFTSLDVDNAFQQSLSHWLDTKLNLSYEIADKLPVDILIGLDFNLPTGKTDLSIAETLLIMDPDLVSITSFGEGFNINPTVIFSKQWGEKLVTGLGVGYVFRGEYDFSQIAQNYEPGDIFSIAPEIRYFFTDQWNARLFGKYSWFDTARLDSQFTFLNVNKDFFEQGDFYLAGFGVNHQRARWSTGLTFTAMFRGDNRYRTFTGTSSDLSNAGIGHQGEEYDLNFAFKYLLTDRLTFKSLFRAAWIREDHDQFSQLDHPFLLGDREVYSLLVGLTGKLTEHIEGEVNVKGFGIPEARSSLSPFVESGFTGLAAEIKITGLF